MHRVETLAPAQVGQGHHGGGRLGPRHRAEAQGEVRRYVDGSGGERGLEAPGLGVAGDGQSRVGEEQGEGAHQNIE